MQERKLNVLFVNFAYGGNGGIAMQLPCIGDWMIKTIADAKADERTGWVKYTTLSDTPITMSRNRAVLLARAAEADVLVMIDSDQEPDLYLGVDPQAKPFWDSSFDFLYKNWDAFPAVIASPYCGPPPHPVRGGSENVYVFLWENNASVEGPESCDSLEAFTRRQASRCMGIEPVAALPTGLSMFAMPIFECTEPKPGNKHDGWFYYEWKDQFGAEKASTEDVTATRDMALAGYHKYGRNPVHVNWDAWAGHHKPLCVGKPMFLSTDAVADRLQDAVLNGVKSNVREVNLDALNLAAIPPVVQQRMQAEQGGQRLEATDGQPAKQPA